MHILILPFFLLAHLLIARPETHFDFLALLVPNLHLAGLQSPQGHYSFASHLDHASASDPPHVDTDTAERSARERQEPFDVIRRPALRDPEQGLLREPELENEAYTGGAEPAECGGDAVEVGAEGLEGFGYGVEVLACVPISSSVLVGGPHHSCRIQPSSCRAGGGAWPTLQSHPARKCCSYRGAA